MEGVRVGTGVGKSGGELEGMRVLLTDSIDSLTQRLNVSALSSSLPLVLSNFSNL